ncbi:class I SAM-dependent methyltransferase [Verrucomicrobium sp. BvORR034]|uniref:class I SAM-dependent methyltransferase n=1 Tax=Verrucomicrobium sp. BvORR034 TaxID=1396418 RepID=UPI0009DF47BD|nr:class I SAM-dependent methyltransferase [Verrucomicrobium sp. BvORR034]
MPPFSCDLCNEPEHARLNPRQFHSDEEFDCILPEQFQNLSQRHWTPVGVAFEAARFLVDRPGARVLDVGCGLGKFCAAGASITQGYFVGVEQRGNLVRIAQSLLQHFQIPRVEIVQGNILDIDFRQFDAFYLFNPFQENSLPSFRIDSSVTLDPKLYDIYTEHVYRQLSAVPLGTRVATYWGDQEEIPDSYECVESLFDDRLRFWIKKRRHALLACAGVGAVNRSRGASPSVQRGYTNQEKTLLGSWSFDPRLGSPAVSMA